jgi:teichuronic acid biosynthesis glycosyltransferase TuaH
VSTDGAEERSHSVVPVVYLYPESRWQGNSSRQQMLCEALSERVPVVFLSTASPSRALLDVKRPRAERVRPGVTVVHDALALRTNRWWRRLGPVAARIDGLMLRRLLRSLGIGDYVYWLSVAGPEWLAGMRLDRLVYDCIDPNFIPENQASFDAREYAVAAEASVVFCTAQTLLERMRRVHPHAYLLNNAASPEIYELERSAAGSVPGPLQGRPGPIIGYMGTTDWRLDCETLTEAAKRLPEFTFCIAGRVNADQEDRVVELRSLPNVVMPGAVSNEEGASYNNAFDVGVIPYLPGYVGDAINPVKMYMYLLTGKPVVSTWINECRLAQPHVRATRTPAEFVDALREAVSEPDERAREGRIEFARQNTWGDRAREAVAVLRSQNLLPPPG